MGKEFDHLLLRFGRACISGSEEDMNYNKGLIEAYITQNYTKRRPVVSHEEAQDFITQQIGTKEGWGNLQPPIKVNVDNERESK